MFQKLILVCALLATTGCASIVSGSNQSLGVGTTKDGKAVAGAACTLVNDKGTWLVTTPGSVTVHRSYNDMTVTCSKEALDNGIAVVKSSVKGMAFGNILFGGIIGGGVDAATGAAYDYPQLIYVAMGQTTTIAPPPDTNKAPGGNTATPVAAQTTMPAASVASR